MSTNKTEEKVSLRRSSRSTRGSLKPVVDLTKVELSDTEEEPRKTKSKAKKQINKDESEESDAEIQALSGGDDDDDEKDEDFEEPKSRRASKATKTTKARAPKDVVKEKATKKGNKQEADVAKAATKTKKASSKVAKAAQQDKEESPECDDVNICYDLSEKEMKEVNDAFDANRSKDLDEHLSNEELKTAIRSLGFEPRSDEISKLMSKFSNSRGKISRDGFHKIMAFKMGSSPGVRDNVLNDEISRVFNLLDLDKTGMITLNNLKSIAEDLNEQITEEELHEMIAEADLDGDFQINRQEFYNIMKKTSLY